jgi:hypothetical protein
VVHLQRIRERENMNRGDHSSAVVGEVAIDIQMAHRIAVALKMEKYYQIKGHQKIVLRVWTIDQMMGESQVVEFFQEVAAVILIEVVEDELAAFLIEVAEGDQIIVEEAEAGMMEEEIVGIQTIVIECQWAMTDLLTQTETKDQDFMVGSRT